MKNKRHSTPDDAESIFSNHYKSFVPLPGHQLGATDSAHGVFFGRAGKHTVAIKPFSGEDALASAEHEYGMLETVRNLGFQTLKPMRVVNTANALAFLLTEYQENLTTLSTVLPRDNHSTTKLLQTASKHLGEIHAAHVTHGDAQTKNHGIDSTEKPMLFDFERGGSDTIGHVRSDPYAHDMRSLMQSLAYARYGGPHVETAAERVFEDVVEPYVSSIGSETYSTGQKPIDVGINSIDCFVNTRNRLMTPD